MPSLSGGKHGAWMPGQAGGRFESLAACQSLAFATPAGANAMLGVSRAPDFRPPRLAFPATRAMLPGMWRPLPTWPGPAGAVMPRTDRMRAVHGCVCTLLLLAFLGGCAAADFAPGYDPQTATQVAATYKAVTRFYMRLRETAEGERAYAGFAPGYDEVAVEMKTLAWSARRQAHNRASRDMARRLQADWREIEARHRKRDSYADALADIDEQRLDNLLDDMASVESHKRKLPDGD